MAADEKVMNWLRSTLATYELDLVAVLRKEGTSPSWPLSAKNSDELVAKLAAGGHLAPLPKEPAALANVLEVSLVDFLIAEADRSPKVQATRGTERGYPDIELTGTSFGGGFHAIDIKIARRGASGRTTQSPITLYTGNTYFRWPTLHWPGTFRPFAEYESHIDVLGIYTLAEDIPGRVADLELIVQEPWRVASRNRSSSTREYIGAVKNIDDLREGRGAFATEQAFYDYWRKYRFKIGPTVEAQLERLLSASQAAVERAKKR